MSSQISLILLN